MPRFPLVVLAATALGLSAPPVPAQVGSWAVLTEADDPTLVALALHCPVFDAEAGRAFCLALGCTPDDPFSFGFSVAGYPPPADWDFAATYSIDGTEFPPVPLRRRAAGSFDTVVAAYDPARHAGLLDALRRGLRLSVRFEGDALPPQDVALNASMVSIDRAQALCAARDDLPPISVAGQEFEVWEMLRGDPEARVRLSFRADGTLAVTGAEGTALGRWEADAAGAVCLTLPGETAPACGVPELVGRDLSLRLEGPDGTLAARFAGRFLGPAE